MNEHIDILRVRDSMMRKTAEWGGLLPSWGNLFDAAGALTALGATYLIASSLLTGTGIGWAAAQLSSPGKQDKDTIRKSYTNERLNADIGYVRENLKHEQALQRKAQESAGPKAMRVFG